MNIWVFILLTLVIFGGFAFLMGQAIADTWRPAWQNVPYGLLLTGANRFLDGALFKGDWFHLGAFAIEAAVIIAIALFAHRVTLARKMVTQYPWLYEPAGLLSWRNRAG